MPFLKTNFTKCDGSSGITTYAGHRVRGGQRDKATAKIGGEILAGGLLKALGENWPDHALVRECYIGWSTFGGYGPFSSFHGLGVDQVVSAKVFNAKGDILEADDKLLKGIRRAGGIFGVIVELTIKMYPLKEVSDIQEHDHFYPFYPS